MKVYLLPDTSSRGIMRVCDALVQYAPEGIELVEKPWDADLEIIHVYGRHDAIERRVRLLKEKKKPYAMIQYALRSTMNPNVDDWIDMWSGAKVVWSYYDLLQLCLEDGIGTEAHDGFEGKKSFNFYHAPLGVDSNVFKDRMAENHVKLFWSTRDGGLHKRFTIAACSQHALAEGARECAFATKRIGGQMFFLGHELRRGSDIYCKHNISDEELADYYSQCDFVSGLRRVEGFELPVIEGALCGARPIVYDKPHYRQWFDDFAVFVKEGTRDELINDLESIFKADIPPVSEEEKQMIKERFDWNTIITNFWKQVLC